jgi:hypothetical protein
MSGLARLQASAGLKALALILFTLALAPLAGCGNSCQGFSGYGPLNGLGCGGGPPIPPQTALMVEGTPGTPFNAMVSDTVASYQFNGVTPLGVVYVNNTPPVKLLVLNKSKIPAVISIEGIIGGNPVQLATSSVPGGTITVTIAASNGQTLSAIAPPPQCDARFYVNSPAGDYYQSLVESNNNAYQNATIAPSLYLVGAARGQIDGVFVKTTNYTLKPLVIDLMINGQLKQTQVGTSISLVSQCP